MSLDAELGALMEPVAGAVSIAELLADPKGIERLEAFGGAGLDYSPRDVPVTESHAPGPNGPVPLRVYGSAPGPLSIVSRSTMLLPRARRLNVDGPPTSTRK